MRIAVLAETDKAEPRVAATPETVKKFIGLGAEIAVQAGAGAGVGLFRRRLRRRRSENRRLRGRRRRPRRT